MPRLVNQPPRYRRIRTRAVCTFQGRNIDLGRYDSPKSHEAYQAIIDQWKAARAEEIENKQATKPATVVELRERIASGGQVFLAEPLSATSDEPVRQVHPKSSGQQNRRIPGMKTRIITLATFTLCTLCVDVCLSLDLLPSEDKRPNIVWIMAEDISTELGCSLA